ncbi:hypothetical protein IKE67_09695 [bacterium]|nr:hypothetical protein [bacterium]
MNIVKLITDPAILIIVITFISLAYYTYVQYTNVNKNLIWFKSFLAKYKKSDLSFRFGEFDAAISKVKYVVSSWLEFKNTLVFSESIALKNQDGNSAYQNVSKSVTNIQTTVDPIYFFNEESLVTSKYNSKLIASAATLLTGMGPLFTFLNIAIAFTKVDFSTQDQTLASVSTLMSGMQIAAMCSVLAVSFSLIYILCEKLSFNILCKKPLNEVQELLYSLFDNISSEKFLIELLKETKVQNSNLTGLMKTLPEQFRVALENSISKAITPYLENLLFGLNNVNDSVKQINIIQHNNNDGNNDNDLVDKLF